MLGSPLKVPTNGFLTFFFKKSRFFAQRGKNRAKRSLFWSKFGKKIPSDFATKSTFLGFFWGRVFFGFGENSGKIEICKMSKFSKFSGCVSWEKLQFCQKPTKSTKNVIFWHFLKTPKTPKTGIFLLAICLKNIDFVVKKRLFTKKKHAFFGIFDKKVHRDFPHF